MDVEQAQFNRPAYASATVAPGAANVAEVSIQTRNLNGVPMGGGFVFLFLSDSAIGVGLTAVTASGAVQCKNTPLNGVDVSVLSAKKALLVQPRITTDQSLTATYVLSITDAAKTPFKVCLQIGGFTQVVATLTTASYG
jgi:hypothetical protein